MELKGHDPDCDRMWVLIHSLGDSEPSDEEIQEILAHFARCTACTDAEANVEEMLMVYKNQAAPPLPAGLEQRLLQYYCGDQENQEMQSKQEALGFGTTLKMPIDQAIELVTAALKEEGFGVLTSIDVKQTMKQKIDVEFEPYFILGACNPRLAHRALTARHDVGLLLPCNVIVHSHGDETSVEVLDPIAMMSLVSDEELEQVAQEARSRLERVVQHLEQSQ